MDSTANTFLDKNQPSVPKATLFAEAQFVAELLKYEFVYKLNPESKEVRQVFGVPFDAVH